MTASGRRKGRRVGQRARLFGSSRDDDSLTVLTGHKLTLVKSANTMCYDVRRIVATSRYFLVGHESWRMMIVTKALIQ